MKVLNLELLPELLEFCQEGLGEAAGALGRTLETEVAPFVLGEAVMYNPDELPEVLAGEGLLLLFQEGTESAFFFLPNVDGVVPEWCREPDATGESKLQAAAQEISMLLIPDKFFADTFKATVTPDIREALTASAIPDGSPMVPFTTSVGETEVTLFLLFPIPNPEEALAAPSSDASDASEASAEEPADEEAAVPTGTLSAALVPELLEFCQEGLGEAANVLGRTLETEATPFVLGEATEYDPDAIPETLAGEGMLLLAQEGDEKAFLFLSNASGVVPEWCRNPDATGESTLQALAQELSMLLIPDKFFGDTFDAVVIPDIREALTTSGFGRGYPVIPLTTTIAGNEVAIYLLFPIPNPTEALAAGRPSAEEGLDPDSVANTATAPDEQGAVHKSPGSSPEPHGPVEVDPFIANLPAHLKSKMRVKVPVRVILATKEEEFEHITQIGPGSIIQFDKSCEEMLDLVAGGQKIASGETVKVGEKFGLQIVEMCLPDEEFKTLTRAMGNAVREKAG